LAINKAIKYAIYFARPRMRKL